MQTIKLLWTRGVAAGILLATLTEPIPSQVYQQPDKVSPNVLLTQQPALDRVTEPVLNLTNPVSWQQLGNWFQLRGGTLTSDQQTKLWQTLTEIINLYAHPDFAQFERYLQRRCGFFALDEQELLFREVWQKQYQAGGAWVQILGQGEIEVLTSEQPIENAISYLERFHPGKSYLQLGRVTRYPGEGVRPCLYARVCFVGVPPASPVRTKEVALPKWVEGQLEWERQQVAIDESARVYCLWLRWDAVVEHWWLDVVGVNNALPRPDNYDLLF